jgi:Type II secretion system (T2SS), protein G
MIAIILSILVPGLGQIYLGKPARGVLMLALSITPLYPVMLVWSVLDCIRLHRQGVAPRFSKQEGLWAIAGLGILFPLVMISFWYGLFRFFDWHQQTYAKPRRTAEEVAAIVRALDAFQDVHSRYPDDLSVIIGRRPPRQLWTTDDWNRPYQYIIQADGQSFTLVSAGRDGVMGTEDDLVYSSVSAPHLK